MSEKKKPTQLSGIDHSVEKPEPTENRSLVSKQYWRSYDELAGTPEFETFLENEFPQGTFDLPNQFSRKKFLGLMGASLALAGLTACRRPVEKIVPYVNAPEDIIPGVSKNFATSMPFGTNSFGVIVETHEGRPTKIEGNPKHSSSMGAANAFIQASILNLYDPDRSQAPAHSGNETRWDDFLGFWQGQLKTFEETRGEGLAILSSSFASPTLSRLKADFLRKFPKATWTVYDPVSDERIYNGIELASKQRLQPVYQLDSAEIILSIDSDFLFLDSNNVANSKRFAKGRRITSEKDSMNRLYAVESGFTVTGGMADHRLKLPPAQIKHFAVSLAKELQKLGVPVELNLPVVQLQKHQTHSKWIKNLAVDLATHKSKSAVVAGYRQPAEVHALVFAINDALRNHGKTITYYQSEHTAHSSTQQFNKLVGDLDESTVKTLVIIGGNPAYSSDINGQFIRGLNRVEHSIHFSERVNETSSSCEWHLPLSNYLESWGDAVSFDGTLSVTQPMIAPLFDSHSMVEVFSLLSSGDLPTGYDIVRASWRDQFIPTYFEKNWRRVLHDGVLADSNFKTVRPGLKNKNILADDALLDSNHGGLECIFAPSSSVWDGEFSNNSWLMENPDPVTKVSWDNVAVMSLSTASKNHLKNKELAKFSADGKSITCPVWILPGHADDTVTFTLGYGRTAAGRIGNKVGVNVFGFKSINSDILTGVKVSGTGRFQTIACTQDHHGLDVNKLVADEIKNRLPAIVREASLDEYKHDPLFVKEVVEEPELFSLWEDKSYEEGFQWGMSVDLNVCTGCNACSIACQSENNIPVVGKSEVEKGREMSWIRLDRYFSGDTEDPEMVFQPVACQHCEMAPCEQVCPVTATVHTEEGLNAMVYNRCVGTRYCANNCPYKVRRFNFFNYTKDLPEIVKIAQNPDVTVRFRGVMEKCTFCVQRINQGKIRAKNDNEPLKDGDIVTACQQTCPTEAIVFGNINDPDSRVSQVKKQNRNYAMLGEINVRPRTTYLAKIRNLNSELNDKHNVHNKS
ncbi:MAG: TAT-variant-translocated molybdopterin oxidoreductase [Candidatus Marinimicrobia bacterium]|nr:TAT-variant-translocated molybdopterin oxidoreductase [Candidatus Neomarinimicrobiota bacterium]